MHKRVGYCPLIFSAPLIEKWGPTFASTRLATAVTGCDLTYHHSTWPLVAKAGDTEFVRVSSKSSGDYVCDLIMFAWDCIIHRDSLYECDGRTEQGRPAQTAESNWFKWLRPASGGLNVLGKYPESFYMIQRNVFIGLRFCESLLC